MPLPDLNGGASETRVAEVTGSEVMKELSRKVSLLSIGEGGVVGDDVGDEPRRVSSDDMDLERQRAEAYEYLCHLEEIRVWIGGIVDEPLPPAEALEENLRNGVYLAKLAHALHPRLIPEKVIYDKHQTRFKSRGLNFKHTENINHWVSALKQFPAFPEELIPETLDVYEKKNMPKVIFCLHAFAMHLFKKGLAVPIRDLVGKVSWPEVSIVAIAKELSKYGLEMPAFSKIGGVLTKDLGSHEAAHHAAVIAINESLDGDSPNEVVDALRRSAAFLEDVDERLGEHYHLVLVKAKAEKMEGILNRSVQLNQTLDAYDELLTGAEIQGFVHCVNQQDALLRLRLAIEKEDLDAVVDVIVENKMGMKHLCVTNVDAYVEEMKNDEDLDRDKVQNYVNGVNAKILLRASRREYLDVVNYAIGKRDLDKLVAGLKHPSLDLPVVESAPISLYADELFQMKINKDAELDLSELASGLSVINVVAAINEAVSRGDAASLESLLNHGHAAFSGVDETGYLTIRYLETMSKLKCAKEEEATPETTSFLTHEDVQDCLDNVKETTQREELTLEFVSAVNRAINSNDDEALMMAFHSPGGRTSIGGDSIKAADAPLYLTMLENAECRKGVGVDALRVEDVRYIVGRAKRLSIAAAEIAELTRDVDGCLENDDEPLFASLLFETRFLSHVSSENVGDYFKALKMSKNLKKCSGDSYWVRNVTKEKISQYVDLENFESSWEAPKDFNPSKSMVSSNSEIQATIHQINSAKNRLQLLSSFEPAIVKFQALCRGALGRRSLAAARQRRIVAATRIQSWWRRILVAKRRRRLKYIRDNVRSIISIQRWWRKVALKKSFEYNETYYRKNLRHIVRIQSWFRASQVRRDYHCLREEPKLGIGVLKKFIHLLDNNGGDFQEELELQRIQHEVIKLIKSNNQLEKGLDEMDVKIGLLIRNRITLQEVVSQNKKISRVRNVKHQSDFKDIVQNNGLKDLNAESRKKLEAYQTLFYSLQTNPSYLARLIFEMPQNRSTKFMESVILTLYNYGSNSREEYLLMKLFETALEREVAQVGSVGKMVDVLNGNPLVVKMIISYARQASSPASNDENRKSNTDNKGRKSLNPIQAEVVLKEVLNKVVLETLTDADLKIETNPVDIYKRWINSVESETGKSSNLPYSVSLEKALEYQAVREKLDKSITSLIKYTRKFLEVIIESAAKLPYVIRFAAAVLRKQLLAKFPDAADKAVLKVVGNLLYYRYINPAVVAPDSFNIVDLPTTKCLTTEQRRNLGSVAKILQLVASKKGFGKESPHLQPLNDFILSSHEKMKKFFDLVCRVDDPEAHFNMNRYYDACLLTKPSILMPAQEVIDTHQLFLEYEDAVCPDDADPLHDILEELGRVTTLEDLFGQNSFKTESAVEAEEAKRTEILLTLSSKESFVDESKRSSAQSLFIRTKHMIIDLIRSQPGTTLKQILSTPASTKEERLHRKTVTRKMRHFRTSTTQLAQVGILSPNTAILKERLAPLDRIKPKVILNLRQLERIGLTSGNDGHESLLREISKDIKNHHQHRKLRRKELNRLKSTLEVLKSKTQFLHEQADYYDQYIESCLANLNGSRRRNWRHSSGFLRSGFAASIRGSRRSSHPPSSMKSNANGATTTNAPAAKLKGPFRFTGRELYEKGVLYSIEGVLTEDLKDVLFEFKATELAGVFEVSAKYMGIVLESLEISIQNLLQLQYENIAVINMCERVEVNVNLLIFLLNKKFFGN